MITEDTQSESTFRKRKENRVIPPEKIDDYVRVSSPWTFLIVIALILVLAALILWGFTGSLPVTETVKGHVDGQFDDQVICFMDASRFSPDQLTDMQASLHMADRSVVDGTVDEVIDTPVSAEEAAEIVRNDWLASNMIDDNHDYYYVVFIEPEENLSKYRNQLVDASVITEEVRPIRFLTQ